MRTFSENIESLKILPHNIAFAYTSEGDYNMDRIIILSDLTVCGYNDYLVLEGGHCSCYGFDETKWDGMIYTSSELRKLATSKAEKEYTKSERDFWKIVATNI